MKAFAFGNLFISALVALSIGSSALASSGVPEISLGENSSSRDVYLRGEVDDVLAAAISDRLLDLDRIDLKQPIILHITSPGGSVYAGLMIYDTMSQISAPVITVCEGYCMSMAALILASGDLREAEPHSTILIHGVSSGPMEGKLPALENFLKETKRLQTIMDDILVEKTGLSLKKLKDIESYDHFMGAEEALSLGLVDKILP